jgi:hypothetical protein
LLLNTKNLNDIKLKGAIMGTGISLAYLASIPDEIKTLKEKFQRPKTKLS